MSQGQHRTGQGNTGRARPAMLKRLVAVPLVLALMSGVAWAYWSASSVPGGGGAAAATTVNQGATPTASVAGTAVTVSWAASTLSNGGPVAGYLIKRYDVTTLSSQTVLSACAGTVMATTCTENNVPTGQWVYAVTPMFASSWRGVESLKSNAVTTDGTSPVSAISMAVLTGNALKSGNTIFYRGAVAGSFTLTNAVSDSGTGPASSSTAVLTGTSTGWTAHSPSTVSTPSGGPYVSNTFSWAAGAASSPTEVVTARDVAGNSAATTLSFVNDSAPPGPDTITYTAGYQVGRSVNVTFTTGTDSGSGIANRQLQRSFATLTAGTCGGYSTFANLGPVNPTSPYTDSSVTNGICYQYRYVVTDQLGNQDIATNPSVTRVDYAGAVNTTAGLLSQWRLGESTATVVSSDSFTGTAATPLTSHVGEIGATWDYQIASANTERISANRVRRAGAGYSIAYTTAVPPSPDYSVEADLYVRSDLIGDMAGVIGRLDTSTNTFYMARWERATTSWNLVRYGSNTPTNLVSVAGLPTLTVGATYRIRLSMTGSALELYVNDVLTASATDSNIAAAGRAGIMDGTPGGTANKKSTTGLHFDNFLVTPITRAADSKGSNTGDYVNEPTLGAAGALAGDANTAAQFDGVNDYVQAVGTTGLPLGASLRSVEMWFKTTSAAQQVLFDYGARANDDEFGLWLNAGGASMTAWGYGPNDKKFTLRAPVNDGKWHQVVKTYDGTSITLYIDGVALPSQAAPRTTTMDSYGFGIGAVIVPGDSNSGGYFNGSLDEVSFYTTVLNQTTVTNHYQLGTSPALDVTGPTGGSVDAGGLVGTGSRYAPSAVLSLNLAKGTDPSGLAVTGAQLLRATATLTSGGSNADGVCGSFGGYTLVTGGTDPVSPKSDNVGDQACYSYQYIVSDTLGNSTTYTSPDIKVDLTAPSAPSLAFGTFANTYWSSGPTVFYRSSAATGSFTTTASATDTASGIATYAFPALGASWTSTPVSTGVSTYSWAGAPAAPGTKSVTATNNSTGTSAGAPFTLTADNAAPTAGTVSYLNGPTTGTSVSVSFTTGTDTGSGVGTRLLQRQSAPLTGSTCGPFGAFATVTNGTNPITSPLVDTLAAGSCFKYQYIVSDNVGNQDTAVSASVVKVASSYLATINGEASLLSYWRLGEATTSSDTFTGTPGATLPSRPGEIGATWTKVTGDDAVITSAGRIRRNANSTSGAVYYSSGIPAAADYTVQAEVYVASSVTSDAIGVAGRLTTPSNGTYYAAVYNRPTGAWTLYSVVNGVKTTLGTPYAQSLVAGTTYRLALDMSGQTISLLVNGVQQVSATNATITTAGQGGVVLGFAATSTTVTDATGMHLDNFTVTPPLADSKGTNNGDYASGPTLGVAGAIVGDANTAAQFNGINDYGTVARQISDDFSIEFWFKSTQGLGINNTQWWQGAGLVDAEVGGTARDFGVSLGSDGRVLAGIGGTPDVSIASSGGYDDGSWHHVVFARTAASGALRLYVDGLPVGSATGSTASVTTPNINFGRIQAGNNYFAGSLDEVAVYNAALSQAAVTAHFDAHH